MVIPRSETMLYQREFIVKNWAFLQCFVGLPHNCVLLPPFNKGEREKLQEGLGVFPQKNFANGVGLRHMLVHSFIKIIAEYHARCTLNQFL